MADLKISALNSLAGADLVAADVVAVVDDSASETKKLTVSDLIANGTTLISDATIPSAKILFSAGAIDTAELAASSVETAKINDSAVTAAKLADNSSVTLVSTLPASGDFTGQIALDTDDDKIYVWDGSAWDSVKGAGSINVVNGSNTGEINIVTSTSGDTVTVSATLDDTTAAAQFLAGPTGAGGTVGYRAIIGTDLPTATTTAKGGVIVNGNGLTMSSDTIAIDNTVTAETSENHIVQYDANGLVTGGRVIAAADVPVATSTTIGVVKPGSGLGVTAAGELNHDNTITAGTAAKVTFDTEGHITDTESLVAADIPDLDASKVTTGTFASARIASDAVTADKLADRSTATIAETTPAGGNYIGQLHLNSISSDLFLWDGNVWQPIGISVGEIILAGTYDASTNLMATVTSEGTALSFVVGSALPAASSANKGYYVVVSEAGTGTSPAPTVSLNPPDFLLSTGTAYTEIDVSSTVTAQQATNVAFTAAGNIAATNVQAAIEELDTEKVAAASPSLTGTVSIGTGGTIQFEGASANDFETTLTVTDPTADRTITLPNVTGTVVTTGDTGSVTSTMITDGTIVNADISASAEIAVSKLGNGSARQVLQTDSLGTGVEFTDDLDLPGTLDVTGAATLDSTLAVTGATTTTGVINADGKVKFPAGSASAPSFYSGTDTNTGLYFSAADEVSITTGGTQRVVVDSSGNVGLGRNTPTAKLALQTSSDDDIFQVVGYNFLKWNGSNQLHYGGYDSSQWATLTFSTSGSERLRINSSGDVGIGTSSIDRLLHIQGAGTSGTQVQIEGTSASAGLKFVPASGDNWEVQANTNSDLIVYNRTDNAQRLTIDSSGRVGIGTASPTADGLHIVNSTQPDLFMGTSTNAEGFKIVYADSSSVIGNVTSTPLRFVVGNTERARIDSSGRVLIGTASANGSGGAELEVAKQTMTTSDMGLASFQLVSNSSRWPQVFIEKSRGSAVGDKDLVSDGDSLGELAFRGSDGANYLTGASIIATVTGTPGTNDLPTALRFSTTADGAASSTERMRIDSSGNVGIGETTPLGKLHVKTADSGIASVGSSADDLVIESDTNAGITLVSNTENAINFADSSDVNVGQIAYNHSSNYMLFRVNDSERLRIDSSGRLGIGTTSPSESLEVAGNGLKISGQTAGVTDEGLTFDWQSSGNNARIFSESAGSSNLLFYTTDSGARDERMRIDSSGKVLIGTTTGSNYADRLLTVGNTSHTSPTIEIRSATNGQPGIAFSDSTASDVNSYRGTIEYNHSSNYMMFRTDASERLRIDSSGNVGIGTTSPSTELHVNGTITDSIGSLRRVGIDNVSSSGIIGTSAAGKLLRVSSSSLTLTIPSGTYTAGDMITFFNVSTGNLTIAQGSSTTIYNSADGATGNRTVAAKGLVTLVCTASNEFVISGSQLS